MVFFTHTPPHATAGAHGQKFCSAHQVRRVGHACLRRFRTMAGLLGCHHHARRSGRHTGHNVPTSSTFDCSSSCFPAAACLLPVHGLHASNAPTPSQLVPAKRAACSGGEVRKRRRSSLMCSFGRLLRRITRALFVLTLTGLSCPLEPETVVPFPRRQRGSFRTSF